MDVFGKGTEEGTRPLLPPGDCWICANSPQQEEMKVIDTRRNTQAGGTLSHASNRIYICEPCVLQLGQALGMASAVETEAAQTAGRALEEQVAQLEGELALARNEQHRVVSADTVGEIVRAELAKLKPATVRKPATPKVTPSE
jgi:hypothetical protein